MDELNVAVELDYRRVLIVPLSKLSDALALIVAHQYTTSGYGKERVYQRIAPDDVPDIKLVPPHALVTARLLGDVDES